MLNKTIAVSFFFACLPNPHATNSSQHCCLLVILGHTCMHTCFTFSKDSREKERLLTETAETLKFILKQNLQAIQVHSSLHTPPH